MLVIRPSQISDIDDLMAISHAVGRGMTSMPADGGAWREKLTASQRAFSDAGANDSSSTYFMVLEDHLTGRVVGTTAIYTGIGLQLPFYSYKISTLVSSSTELAITRQAKVLSMVSDYTGATEIGSLFVLPQYRKPGVGQFLSRGRYLAMADFPERFGDLVMAELRGWQDEQGNSPLWQHLGSKFFDLDFQQAVNTVALKGSQFISDMMPKYPIYLDLLPQAAREVIGQPHQSSAPALNLLRKEGFQFSGYVDLFDGGPSVQATTQEIHTVRDSRSVAWQPSDRPNEGDALMILSNGKLANYRLTMAPARLNRHGALVISPQTAEALQLGAGESVRYVSASNASAAGSALTNAAVA